MIVVGGELTLEMLDLSYNENAKFYEAPMHVKALGGIFTIDDFGRQLVTPESLLNRWIVPLERRVDYLKLHTGKSFQIPFDELVIFSTNLSPDDLMDPAFLRRIPYKLLVGAPSVSEYKQIFHAMAEKAGMSIADEHIDAIIVALRDRAGMPLANYQPKFIIDQFRATCKFAGIPLSFRPELLSMALANLAVKDAAYTNPAAVAKQDRAAA
jgi:SpoVK/Ycf46/Vps4 family AAA+-type ATPase